jgi:putative endonuclease
MPKTIETGKNGEEQAITFLKGLGYEVLASNWRFKHLEIDIVAREKDCLVIVEVKTRKDNSFGEPETFVTRSKQQKLIRAAAEYINKYEIETDVRFDIISVTTSTNQVHHIKDAFYANIG